MKTRKKIVRMNHNSKLTKFSFYYYQNGILLKREGRAEEGAKTILNTQSIPMLLISNTNKSSLPKHVPEEGGNLRRHEPLLCRHKHPRFGRQTEPRLMASGGSLPLLSPSIVTTTLDNISFAALILKFVILTLS